MKCIGPPVNSIETQASLPAGLGKVAILNDYAAFRCDEQQKWAQLTKQGSQMYSVAMRY